MLAMPITGKGLLHSSFWHVQIFFSCFHLSIPTHSFINPPILHPFICVGRRGALSEWSLEWKWVVNTGTIIWDSGPQAPWEWQSPEWVRLGRNGNAALGSPRGREGSVSAKTGNYSFLLQDDCIQRHPTGSSYQPPPPPLPCHAVPNKYTELQVV